MQTKTMRKLGWGLVAIGSLIFPFFRVGVWSYSRIHDCHNPVWTHNAHRNADRWSGKHTRRHSHHPISTSINSFFEFRFIHLNMESIFIMNHYFKF
jgi:hypothetical protein